MPKVAKTKYPNLGKFGHKRRTFEAPHLRSPSGRLLLWLDRQQPLVHTEYFATIHSGMTSALPVF
jgi:hypothetical protein